MASGRPVVLISHGTLIRLMTARWLGLSAAAGVDLALRTASIGRLPQYDGQPSLRHPSTPPVRGAHRQRHGTGAVDTPRRAGSPTEAEHPVALDRSDRSVRG
ncbi:histidine phosphatase family protein [Streptomyces sp. NPDC050564]|uniref:histidine phosphatase family protein n=1 Tax=Streptomyces sp. NPDC050564 TaxID=3365631 RepID=UPI0037877C67